MSKLLIDMNDTSVKVGDYVIFSFKNDWISVGRIVQLVQTGKYQYYVATKPHNKELYVETYGWRYRGIIISKELYDELSLTLSVGKLI